MSDSFVERVEGHDTHQSPPDKDPDTIPQAPADSMEGRYRRWKAQNQRLYDLYHELADEVLARNRPAGIAQLTAALQWRALNGELEGFPRIRLSNNYGAFIAWDLIEEMPALAKLLRTRRLHKRHPR